MNAITFYTHQEAEQRVFEYNIYDHNFAPSNLVVRKIFIAMLNTVKKQLTHLEVEYNDKMIADQLGKRAAEILRLLGATSDNLREQRSGEIVVSRTFQSELTPERFDYFYRLVDLAELPHYRLLAGEQERIEYYFHQYLKLTIPADDEPTFFEQLDEQQVPYQLRPIGN
ncbi:hypothetical protein [Brevibacillus fulvus]|uniref:Uncharacterized protein n=1 Tax=Brevibacillus fulvus TaxID=1125967 RepID=A0A939BSK1_9BACL|nr:hypothetical protein [Brevibacillus fulvus]MBM7590807.1 hypothetical protein [Brevibacillus fulvus]